MGFNNGTVIFQNIWSGAAPSTFAASYKASGISCKAAKYSNIENPIVHHKVIATKLNHTLLESCNHKISF